MAFTLKVKNFQSIEDVELKIEKLTVITGANSAGKSALVRAFSGVFVNSPAKALVRKGAPHLEVGIEFDDQSSVVWRKGKNANEYEINGVFKENVNRGAPEDIADLKIQPIETSSGKLFWPQIAHQHDPVSFVLNETGATLAEIVVSDVDKVMNLNKALALSERQRREHRSEEKIRRKDLEDVQNALVGLLPIREVTRDLGEAESGLSDLGRDLDRLQQMQRIETNLGRVQATLARFHELDEIEIPSLANLTQTFDKIVKCASLFQQFQRLQKIKEKLSALDDIEVPSWDISLDRINQLKKIQERMQFLSSKIDECQVAESKLSTIMTENESKISDVLKTLKYCPTCNQTTEGGDRE